MKSSKYNFFIEIENCEEVLLYNSFTNALGVVNKQDYLKLNNHLKYEAYENIEANL